MRSAIKNYMAMIAVAIIATLVIGAIGVRIDRSQTPAAVDPINATPITDSGESGLLVDANWLLANQESVDHILDLGDIRQYEQGHIPGAAHIWWQDAMRLHAPDYSEPDFISKLASQTDVFGFLNLHIPQDASVVLYDSNNSERASWLLWVMKINGFTDVKVLDGGLAAWIGAGGELSTEGAPAPDTSIQATPTYDATYFIVTEEIQATLDSPDTVLIDTRDAEQQADTVNGTTRDGHIPGAINIQTAEVMREDGTFLSPEELRSLFESYGINQNSNIIVYSLFAHQSGNVWLALQLAGFDQARIYHVGFVAWGYNIDLPISTDPFPTALPLATPSAPGEPETTPTEGPTDLTGD